MLLLSAEESLLLVVDVQTKLLSVIPDAARVVWNTGRLARGGQLLGVPRHATEQYPEKLGATQTELVGLLSHSETDSPGPIPGKLAFSCCASQPFREQLKAAGRRQIVLAGIETHVCVLQTAIELIGNGYDVFVCVDAVAARASVDHDVSLRRMEAVGVTMVTTESVLFEWCRVAGTDSFKQISALVRETLPS